jgi:hypothetical protein
MDDVSSIVAAGSDDFMLLRAAMFAKQADRIRAELRAGLVGYEWIPTEIRCLIGNRKGGSKVRH